LKNNLYELESSQTYLYSNVSKIFNSYHFKDSNFNICFYFVLDVLDVEALIDFNNSKFITIINGFRLLNLCSENTFKTKIILNSNKVIEKSLIEDLKNYFNLSFNTSNYELIIK
jgi:hypothetical protein